MGGSNLYKSEFLRERLNDQNEKRKRERKQKKVVPASNTMNAASKATNEGGVTAGRKRKEA